MHKIINQGVPLRPRATWNEVGPYLCWKGTCGALRISVSLKHWLPFLRVCLLCFGGGSSDDDLGEDESCVVVVFFVVVVSDDFVLVVGFSRVHYTFVCCWLGCRCRGDAGSWVGWGDGKHYGYRYETTSCTRPSVLCMAPTRSQYINQSNT